MRFTKNGQVIRRDSARGKRLILGKWLTENVNLDFKEAVGWSDVTNFQKSVDRPSNRTGEVVKIAERKRVSDSPSRRNAWSGVLNYSVDRGQTHVTEEGDFLVPL